VKGRVPSRWPYFTFFALLNVICWATLAVAVGVLASQEVNLGVETFVREQQTRIVASLRREPPTTPVATPVPVPTGVTVVVVAPTAPAGTATPASGSPTANPAMPPVVLDDPPLAELAALDAELRAWPPGRLVQVSYSQAALNRELAALLAVNPQVPLRDLRAELSWDEIKLAGTLLLLGVEVPIQAEGRVTIVDCRPRVQVDLLTAGGLPAPGLVRDEVFGLLQQWIRWYPADHPLCLQDVALGDETVIVVGVIR
jgi:hypothetical protein